MSSLRKKMEKYCRVSWIFPLQHKLIIHHLHTFWNVSLHKLNFPQPLSMRNVFYGLTWKEREKENWGLRKWFPKDTQFKVNQIRQAVNKANVAAHKWKRHRSHYQRESEGSIIKQFPTFIKIYDQHITAPTVLPITLMILIGKGHLIRATSKSSWSSKDLMETY